MHTYKRKDKERKRNNVGELAGESVRSVGDTLVIRTVILDVSQGSLSDSHCPQVNYPLGLVDRSCPPSCPQLPPVPFSLVTAVDAAMP